jgi:hypothetical protein
MMMTFEAISTMLRVGLLVLLRDTFVAVAGCALSAAALLPWFLKPAST